ncbi:MAG: hypothetical protein HN348_26085, partial [Proteobacteria bacterium]|nr:hypothetical protein [Pseudomonadota bacterium]
MSPHTFRILRQMPRQARLQFLLLALTTMVVAMTAAAWGGGTTPLFDALLQRPQARGTVVVPDRFLRQWDPLTVFFDSERGPVNGGPEDHAERFVHLSPAHPGAWTWLNSSTLQFRPAEPWPPLQKYTWEVEGKVGDLSTLMSPPHTTLPRNGDQGLSEVSDISLTFAEPLPTDILKEMVTVELYALPGVGGTPTQRLTHNHFDIKALDRANASSSATYTLTLNHPIELGTRAKVVFRLALDEDPDESVSEFSFATAEPFRLLRVGCASTRYPISPEGSDYPEDQPISCGRGLTKIDV